MTGPKLERDDEAPPAPAGELTARARGWRIATWIAAGVLVALVVYLLLRSSEGAGGATPAAGPAAAA